MSADNSTLSVSTETHLTISSDSLDTRTVFGTVQALGLRLVAAAPNRIVADKTFNESITVAGPNEIVQKLIDSINEGSVVFSQ